VFRLGRDRVLDVVRRRRRLASHPARGDAGDAQRIDALVAKRIEARKAKEFAEADRIRKELAAEGIEIMDGPQGSTWRRV